MNRRTVPLAVRLLLLVLLATFLSPSIAWEKVAGHGAMAHVGAALAVDEGDHHHEGGGHPAHGHDDAAHGQIGHLLSHLPVLSADIPPLLPATSGGVAYPAPLHAVSYADPEPPYKPPRSASFA